MLKIFLPRFLDKKSTNAQSLNAKSLISHFTAGNAMIYATYSDSVSTDLRKKTFLQLIKIWPWRFWRMHLFFQYLMNYDIIFYPDADIADIRGLKIRNILRKKSTLITTIEGLVGDEKREKLFSNIAGHPVFCQRITEKHLQRTDYILKNADYVIAISPFLANLGSTIFGNKFIVLPLGIDTSIFYKKEYKTRNSRPIIISAGSLKENKRPEVFSDLAKRYPQADFIWYGDGILRDKLIAESQSHNISNLCFPGSLQSRELAVAFREADIFILPSKSEGVPKVTQEAAACGLPVILFGFYEAPSVIDKKNGFVVWTDDEFFQKVGYLLESPKIAIKLGKAGAKMGEQWDWKSIAQQWEKHIIN